MPTPVLAPSGTAHRPATWAKHATAYKAFLTAHHRHPNHSGLRRPERALAVWMSRQRGSRNGTLTPNQRTWLTRYIPGWEHSPAQTQTWYDHAQRLTEFWATHSRPPRKRSAHRPEAHLSEWLTSQRQRLAAGTLAPDRQEWLNQHLPRWETLGNIEDQWGNNAQSTLAFYTVHGTFPQQKVRDPDECRLGNWLGNQRRKRRAGTLDPRQYAWLDEQLPTWTQTRKYHLGTPVLQDHPHLADYWDPALNPGVDIGGLSAGSNTAIIWCCPEGHTFRRLINIIVRSDHPCPTHH